MKGPDLGTMDVVVCGAFVVLTLFVASESVKLGIGWGDSGPDAGFFPFALAVIMGGGALGAGIRGLAARARRESRPFFEHPVEIVDLLRVGLPMAAAIAAIPVLGLYLTTGLYIFLFAWWYGGFRWYASLAAGAISAGLLVLVLQRGFGIPMPRSLWYGEGLPV